ncbi:MAG: DUF6434 domain-containing protein [Pseudomonadota bacterium]
MRSLREETRPEPDPKMAAAEFARWYWSVAQLHQFCEVLRIAATGTKAQLRERVAEALAGERPQPPERSVRKPAAMPPFDWRRAPLFPDTVITETVSFGPNLRGFFKTQIGRKFVCHADFMDWMRQNAGQTLQDAVDAWWLLEARKADPAFRREIAECNNYLQYLRAIRDAHPELTLDDAKRCWDEKKLRPAQGGYVTYAAEDLRFLGR